MTASVKRRTIISSVRPIASFEQLIKKYAELYQHCVDDKDWRTARLVLKDCGELLGYSVAVQVAKLKSVAPNDAPDSWLESLNGLQLGALIKISDFIAKTQAIDIEPEVEKPNV